MKKFFTLIVMALMAISANAKENIDFSNFGEAGSAVKFGNWDWKTVNKPSEGEAVVDGAKADDSGITYFDASAYDYLVLKYSSCSVETDFIIQYDCKGTAGQYGAEFYEGRVTVKKYTNGLVGIKLDADHKNKVLSIALQSHGEGTLAVEELYWASEAEYTEAVAANPETEYEPPVDPQMILDLSNLTNGWGENNIDAENGEVTIVNNGAYGWWTSTNPKKHTKLVVELAGVQKSGWFQLSLSNDDNYPLEDGSYIKVIDISGATEVSRVMFQGGAGTKYTIKQVYFATDEYITANGIKDQVIYNDTQDLLPSFGSSGWDAKYDATTKTITITGEDGGGKGWWYGENGVDYSHFDNAVIELYPAATAGGFFKIDYADGSTEAVEFYPGATCIVAALNAEKKSAIKQIYVQGVKGAAYTLSAAFVAVAAATPEAALGTAPIEADTWTVAGTLPLVEKTWDPSDENADMTSEDGVTYTYVKEDLVLEANTNYEFKVVKNHAWGEEYPGSNYVLTVPETAKYKVTITFNAETKEVSATYEKTGEAGPVEHTWSVKGNFNNDDNWEKEYDMTKGDDGKFTVVIKDVKAGKWEFKVRADHDWSIAFPGSNKEVTIEKDNSTVTITFDPSDNSIVVVVDAPSDELEGDTNGDGEVNVADIDIVIEAIGEEYNKAADANGDGEVNVADADFIIERIGGTEE